MAIVIVVTAVTNAVTVEQPEIGFSRGSGTTIPSTVEGNIKQQLDLVIKPFLSAKLDIESDSSQKWAFLQ